MERKINIHDLRERQLQGHVAKMFRIRMLLLPLLGAFVIALAAVDGHRLRLEIIATAFAFELLVALYYAGRPKRLASAPSRDIVINVIAVALGGISVLYATGDLHSPILPLLILPATLIGGVFGLGPIRFLVFFPLVGFTLVTTCGVLGWLPRFPPLLSGYPDWQIALRTTVIGAAILQTWRITGWLTEDVMQLARKVEAAYDDLGHQFASQQRASALFVGQLAHELRNPLASVKGLAELVRSNPGADNTEHLRIISEEIRRLESTLDATLSYGRPAPTGDMAYFELRDCVQSALRILDIKLLRHTITVVWDWDEALVLKGDEQGFRQVFFNLISNAIDAMPGGGSLRIAAKRERDEIIIVLQDSGPGVPAAMQEKIFEPYVSGKAKGGGLGLSIVRQILQAHGGTVGLRGGAGQGAIVELRLPLEPKA